MNPPMEIEAAGGNILYGTPQGVLLVLVRDTQDVCRKAQFSIVFVPGLKNIFSSVAAGQKGVKTV